ncbi:hypothetical protein JTB14_011954 [Gonioctena quinquepunctata]|nr:hypothetical protein JTB14_011954 [Gonioctena quinquepunctata]
MDDEIPEPSSPERRLTDYEKTKHLSLVEQEELLNLFESDEEPFLGSESANAPSLPDVMEDGYVDYFLKIPAAVPVVDQQCESEKGHESYVIEFESGSETPSDLDIPS